jgi:hypothetical protein
MWGDILEKLKPSDLRIAPGVATLRDHILRAEGAPTNEEILNALKRFYDRHTDLVDTTTLNADDVRTSHPDYVRQLHSYNWQNKQLTKEERDQTSSGVFGDAEGKKRCPIFKKALDKIKASQLFTTIGVGISADVCFGVGGYAGLGCAWDIARREGPKGYGYATLELGLKVGASTNLQVPVFNKLPSQLNTQIYGLVFGVHAFGGAALGVFWTGMRPSDETLLGYAPAVGLGVDFGAAVFGGHISNFG